MKLITLGKEPKHVCLRYRIDPVRAAFRAQGHWFSIQKMPRTLWGRWALYRELRHAHVVVLQRKLLSTWELPLLRRAARHLIFDFDDAFFQNNSTQHNTRAPRRLTRFKAMVQAADQVFAGSAFLAEAAARFTHGDKITIMPTCVDASRYQPAQHTHFGHGVRLVWIGSSGTLQGMQQQTSLWNAIGQAFPGIQFHIICDRFPNWPGINTVPIIWSEETETTELARCDIGIAWLPDDDWSRGKCGLKVLQYQAAGLPVIANPVGMHNELVKPGHTGYLANSTTEWIDAIRTLMHNPLLRHSMGLNARKQVETHYDTNTLILRWKQALSKVNTNDLHSKVAA